MSGKRRWFAPPLSLRKHDWIPGLLAVAVVLALYSVTDLLSALERRMYDLGVATAHRSPADDIAIVAIDDTLRGQAGAGLPTRADLAQMIDLLAQAGAAQVVLALPFDQRQPESASDASTAGDERLARSLHANPRVLLGSQPGAPPIASLAAAATASGEISFETDVDGVVRSMALFAGADAKGAPVLALVVAARRLDVALSEIRRLADTGVRIGTTLLLTEQGDRVRPHFYRAARAAHAFAQDAFDDVLSRRIPASRYSGKIVFIGVTRSHSVARLATPLGVAMSPVEVLAHASSALSKGHLVVQPTWATGVSLLAGAAVMALIMWRWPTSRAVVRLAWAIGLTVLSLAAQWALQITAGLTVPLVLPLALLWAGLAALAIWPRWQAQQPSRDRGSTHDMAAGEIANAAAPPRGAPLAPPRQVPRVGASRTTLGHYIVDREIGHGAMGAVYLAHDPRNARVVAIKTLALRKEFDGNALEEARQRFTREAQMAGRLRHPDIVTIFDSGEDRELAWIAMEYLRGRDLAHYARPAMLLPVPLVLRIVSRVAQALAHAHRQGVVHRDIKPANVMVDLPADVVKVTDFGIAHIADANRTRSGMVLGTPSFMSPEQMAGSAVDGRSDLYSLGVLLFQLLTSHLPHEAESMARLMAQIANEPAPDVRSWRPDLPEALANVVALALEKRAEVRYGDGYQMAADLRAVAAQLEASLFPVASTVAPASQQGGAFADTVPPAAGDPRHNSGP